MTTSTRWMLVLTLGLGLFAFGCGDDVTVIDVPGSEAGSGGGAGWNPIPTEGGSLSCDAIVASLTAGASCESNETCGQGGRCITTSAGARVCAQVCFPEDSCDTCGEGAQCTRLLDASGQAIRFDLNSDGTPETIAGACQSRAVVGDRGLFETCGAADGACQSGLVCVQATGASAGTCLEACDGACDNFEGVLPACSSSTLDTDVCIIACSTDADTELPSCPSGLVCTDVAMGNQACLR